MLKESSIFVGDDIFPRLKGNLPNEAALKSLTLLHDRLYFDMISEKEYETSPRWKQIPTREKELHRNSVRVYEDLFVSAKDEAPRRWKKLQKIWKPLPYDFNTVANAKAYLGVHYGATSLLPGFLELDYFVSTALHRVRQARTGDYRFTDYQFHSGIHVAWLWCAAGVGLATEDPHLFEALRLFARAGRQIRFTGKREDIYSVLEAVRSWDPIRDKLFEALDAESPTKTFEWLIPDFDRLSWDEIINLRSHRMHNKFRRWYVEQCTRLSDPPAQLAISQVINESLWQLAREVQPSVGSTLAKGFIGNLPLGVIPVNPVGIVTAIMDVNSQVALQERYGWLFWLSEARGLSRER